MMEYGYIYIPKNELPKTKDDIMCLRLEFVRNALRSLVEGVMTSDRLFAGLEALDKVEDLLPEWVDEPDE